MWCTYIYEYFGPQEKLKMIPEYSDLLTFN